MVVVYAGYSANLTTRVMLVEGTEAPGCFTPTGVHGVEPEGMVVAGKNLLPSLEEWSDETYSPGYIRYAEVNIPPGTYITRCDGVPDGSVGNYALWLRNDIPDKVVQVGSVLAWGYKPGPHVSTNPVTIDEPFRYVVIQSSKSMMPLDPSQFKFQLELGSTATAYEPPDVTEVELPETDPLMDGDVLTIAQDGAVSVDRSDGTTDQLGTVQTPQLPAPTFNAYPTGGYVPGETAVDYERDVNIAYAELEAKIAALTVTQATS